MPEIRRITVEQAITEQLARVEVAEGKYGMTVAEAWALREGGDWRWQVCEVLGQQQTLDRLQAIRDREQPSAREDVP